MKSISRFLLISLLAAVLGVTLVASLWIHRDSTHQVEELFDAELAQMSRVLQSLFEAQLKHTQLAQFQDALQYRPADIPLESSEDTDDDEATPFGHKYESKLAFVVWNGQGDELLSSQSRGSSLSFSNVPGYSSEQLDDHHWRSFMLRDPELNLWIKVAQRSDVRDELTGQIVEITLLPLLLTLPLLGLLIAMLVRRGLRPLRLVSDQLGTRNPDHMAPLDSSQVPAEIHNVVEAVNALLARLKQALERERRFTADAAHELRTPLAAIRIHAQNLRQQRLQQALASNKQAPSPATSAPDHIITGIDRMTHAVEQLLTLSRLEFSSQTPKEPLDLSRLLRQCLADLIPLALDRAQDIELDAPEACLIKGNAASLVMLCRNLLDNAIRYTPEQGQIRVSCREQDGRIWVSVADTGPGIPVAERTKVLQRFYRLADQSINGSGLGLSIVQQIVDQHGATLSLHASELAATGLEVRLCFSPSP
ncbi:MAG: two-component system sensor histidine kinase QseC [Motiliproteus sp.]|jgi:two-component system sensor histidine kinase QseC